MARLHRSAARLPGGLVRGKAHWSQGVCERCGTDIFMGPNRKTMLCSDCSTDPLFNEKKRFQWDSVPSASTAIPSPAAAAPRSIAR